MEPKTNTKEWGEYQKRRIIDALRRQPMTEWQLAEQFGVVRNTITMHMTELRRQNRVHRSSYIKSVSGRPLPVYSAGNQPDAVYVPKKVRKPKQPDRVETMKAAILALLVRNHTAIELGEKLNRSASVIRFYIREMRTARLVRIADWKQSGARNGWAPVYRVGKAADKPRPARLTCVEYHARRRADPEKRELEQKQRKLRDNIKKLRRKPANPFAALGG